MDPPSYHTLSCGVGPLTITSSLAYGQVIPWNNYDGYNPMKDFYEFFEPLSYRVTMLGPTLSTTQAMCYTLALFPIDYNV
jgi:hypothetical protein